MAFRNAMRKDDHTCMDTCANRHEAAHKQHIELKQTQSESGVKRRMHAGRQNRMYRQKLKHKAPGRQARFRMADDNPTALRARGVSAGHMRAYLSRRSFC